MLASSLAVVMTLCHFIALGSAAPAIIDIAPSSLRPRKVVCQNDPATVAGRFLQRRDPSTTITSAALFSRSNNIVWCAPGTNTYVVLHMFKTLPSNGVIELLDETYNAVHEHLRKLGDGALAGGMFEWSTDAGYVLQAWNKNNHQTTWGVLAMAVTALLNYMTAKDLYGAVTFFIYDGMNQVGAGQIGKT